ncbi:natural killer cell receptor 2B4-like isoform X2 [Pseudorasbora parva]|uniref:natural killer cell receptor 2B4-like isoform X2 n=1 Tax=Pseudorasbora parva TaxID=51549 RepID=UPI00351EC2A9
MRFKTVFISSLLVGVFGAEMNNSETVSVLVGDSVTLDTEIENIKRNDDLLWKFGPNSTLIAKIIKWSYMFSIFVSGQLPFRDRLQLDHQTGSLTIKNTRSEHSGVYKLTIISGRKTFNKSYSLKIYAPLPIPIIHSVSVQNSTEPRQINSKDLDRSLAPACALMCSVKNATGATLSLYKGNDLVSSVNSSDFNSNLSLPLDMEYHDDNTYSCVVNNPFSNQTTLLNVTDLCKLPSDSLLYCLVLLVLIPVSLAVCVILYVCRKRGKTDQEIHTVCSKD